MVKSAYVGLETINAYVAETAAATLTASIVSTGCDRYANRIMEIWGYAIDLTPVDFVVNQLISSRWSLSTNPNKTTEPWVNNRDAVIAGVRHVYCGATSADETVWTHQPLVVNYELPIEVADDELYFYLQTVGANVPENALLRLYIKYKEVTKEHFLDVLETFR